METHTQDTHPQDPIDRFTLRIEEMRSMRGVYGPARLLHKLFLDFFMSMFRVLASLAEQRRNGTLPETAPTGDPDEPRAWPPLRARESGWAEYRSLEDPWGDSTTQAPATQPEVTPEINGPIAAVQAGAPAALPLPRSARVRKCKKESGPAPARPRHADEGAWPLWRGAGLLWITDAGLLRFFSKKAVLGGADKCVRFVSI
jgi:hypothetical protein